MSLEVSLLFLKLTIFLAFMGFDKSGNGYMATSACRNALFGMSENIT